MMKKPIPLTTLQQWMQAVIEHPGTSHEAWHSVQAQQQLPFVEAFAAVLPSASLTPMERIAIYRRMFVLRMTESMAIDYPGVKSFLGEEAFDRIVTEEYVRKYPSKSYTLNHLGRFFPEFLNSSGLPEKNFLSDLARLELAITNNLEAEETPVATAEQIASVPPNAWEHVRLIPITAMELLKFESNVCAYLDAVTEETALPLPEQRQSFAVVYRKEYRSYWEVLSEQQWTLLSALAAGKQFGHSIGALLEQFPGSEEKLQDDLFHWFNDWVGKGLFSRIE